MKIKSDAPPSPTGAPGLPKLRGLDPYSPEAMQAIVAAVVAAYPGYGVTVFVSQRGAINPKDGMPQFNYGSTEPREVASDLFRGWEAARKVLP